MANKYAGTKTEKNLWEAFAGESMAWSDAGIRIWVRLRPCGEPCFSNRRTCPKRTS